MIWWLIGYLFTLGFVDDDTLNFGDALYFLLVWPVALGVEMRKFLIRK